ncbi:UbiA prenyltransferase [Hypoxylon crocopeplum]|nr:UbiA prenyltransferase [Hypoxylon crocopeplum]
MNRKHVNDGIYGQDEAPPVRFDGLHTGAWVELLPSSWVPYVQLARLSPPVPLLLIFFPHIFGILHAAVTRGVPLAEVIRVSLVLFGGSIFVSNAIHGWNDLIDAPIDKLIPRTRNRPIPRGAITPRAAFVFTASQAVVSTAFLLFLPEHSALYAMPSIIAHTYYPFAKRHTNLPQVILAIALQWPIILASFATEGTYEAATDESLLCLFLASVLWTVTYDTVYGYQDYKQDIRLGVGSTAVLFGTWGRPILWVLSNSIVALVVACGQLAGMGSVYFAVAAGGCFVSLNFMMAKVNLLSPESCSWWFTYGFWGPAVAISGGLFLEYLFL